MFDKTKYDLLMEVVRANRELQAKARQWNVRAGQEVFKILSRQEWEQWLAERLQGAISVATIPDLDSLRLPPLDQEIVNLIMQENPDTIEVLGQTCKVEYVGMSDVPRLRIDFRGEQANDWQKLPDEIRLPGGREVVVYSAVDGYRYYIDAKSAQFKAKVRECLNQGLWDNWRDRPTITAPDMASQDACLPEIASAQYGVCVVTGEPLIAFGITSPSRYWGSDPIQWKAEWFRTRSEAEKRLESAKVEFDRFKAEEREKREREEARKAAEAAQAKMSELYEKYYHGSEVKLESGVREKLYSRRYAYLPPSSAELKQWTAETNAVIAEVEVAVAEADRIKAEEEARRAKAAEILLGIIRSHYSICQLCGQKIEWVIESAQQAITDGSFPLDNTHTCPLHEHAVVHAIQAGINSPVMVRVARLDADVICRSTIAGEPVVSLAVFKKWGNWNAWLVVDRDVLVKSGGLAFEQVWKQPSGLEIKLFGLKREQESYEGNLASAVEAAASGYALRLQFHRGKNPKTDKDQWEAGSKHDKYVLDQRSAVEPTPGRWYYCRQVRVLVETPAFRLTVVEPYLEEGRDFAAEIAALEKGAKGEDPKAQDQKGIEQTGGTVSVSQDMLAALKNKWGAK